MTDFKDKVVLVTGSSSGIGAATAVQFAERGANVVITGRNEEGVIKTKTRCLDAGAQDEQIFTVIGDLSKREGCANVIQETVDKFEKIDVLVNNAGEFHKKHDFLGTTPESILKAFNVNTMSAFNMTQLAMPYLLKTKGNVVNVSSILGYRPGVGFLPYTISKAAMDELTQCLALEFGKQGVRINSVNPGTVMTPLCRRSGCIPDTDEAEAEEYRQSADYHAMNRVAEPEEVAAAIRFLASSEASFSTGVLLNVDGGRFLGKEGL